MAKRASVAATRSGAMVDTLVRMPAALESRSDFQAGRSHQEVLGFGFARL
jgi:hypothetical protein